MIIRIIDNGPAGAHRGQNVDIIMEKGGQLRIDPDPATGAKAHKPLFADQVFPGHTPGLQQFLQGIKQLLFSPVAMTALGKHLMTALEKLPEKLLLVTGVMIDDNRMRNLDTVHLLHPVNNKGIAGLQLQDPGQVLRRRPKQGSQLRLCRQALGVIGGKQ